MMIKTDKIERVISLGDKLDKLIKEVREEMEHRKNKRLQGVRHEN